MNYRVMKQWSLLSLAFLIGVVCGVWGSVLPAAGQAAENELAKAQKYLEDNLIAPCCFKQTLTDHDSPEADDMKREIAALLRSGKTVAQVKEYYVKKYGERILASPKMEGFNMTSTLLPAFIFAFGFFVMLLTLRRMVTRRPPRANAPRKDSMSNSVSDRIESDLNDYK